MGEFKIEDEYEIPEGFELPDHVEMWYDVHTKLWVLQTKDVYDNQIGDAVYISGKQNAIKIKIELENKL